MATQNIQPRPVQQVQPQRDLRGEVADMVKIRGGELLQLLPDANGTDKERRDSLARFQRQIMVAVDKNPALLDCGQRGLWLAFLHLASLGLDPSGNNGESAVVPFKGVATPMIMARGYVMLAIRSGAAQAIDHGAVCEGDLFDYELGSDAYIRHKPALRNRGDLIAVWAVAVLPSGQKVYEVIGWDEVEGIRARSRSGEKGPWVTDPAEMGRKTVLRRIMKRLPWSSDDMMDRLVQAQSAEDAAIGIDLTPRKEIRSESVGGLAGLRERAGLAHEPEPQPIVVEPQEPRKDAVPNTPPPAPANASQRAGTGPCCPKCRATVDPMIADEVLRMGNCPACEKK
jgi:recombination protein RecT